MHGLTRQAIVLLSKSKTTAAISAIERPKEKPRTQ